MGYGNRPSESDVLRYATKYIEVDWEDSFHGIHADIDANLNNPLPIPEIFNEHALVSFEVLEHLAELGVRLAEAFRILQK